MRRKQDDMQMNVAGIRRNIKNLAHNYSDAQVKVREATSNDPWGPSATVMSEIADLTYNVVAFSEIMQMIWKRLNDHGKNWRHVYKALILLEYLIKTGTEKVAAQCKENIFAIQTLREFVHFEEGKDSGTHVREKAKQLVTLLRDDERLKNERAKALKAKERFAQHPSGFGSDGYVEGPTNRDVPPGWGEEPPRNPSELEFVRPQTAGEEELQLQLAMAMSREEAEQEEAKRRSDDVRLQLAISQSQQEFTPNEPKIEKPQQSHLMDLLDIALDANSPLHEAGAVGGSSSSSASVDAWGISAQPRAASQLSDPWSGTTSPQLDPWKVGGAVAPVASSQPPKVEPWRTQSPAVMGAEWNASGGNTNGNNIIGSIPDDPWLSKPNTNGTATSADPWLNSKPVPADPWKAPEVKTEDLWSAKSPVKTSPDLDDFDVITNRSKTADSNSGPSNNNNASLLDEMDPLSSKKNLKTPQSFLGENSSLVNLDNLIKPINTNSPAYNPFSDTVPQRTNLFQQQQPAVPSMNQLKQQQAFPSQISQDPWAPVNSVNNTNLQVSPMNLIFC
ncbi:EPN2 family protein [Megaselia abdita]